jgi:hypothetical protein
MYEMWAIVREYWVVAYHSIHYILHIRGAKCKLVALSVSDNATAVASLGGWRTILTAGVLVNENAYPSWRRKIHECSFAGCMQYSGL